MAKTTEDPKPTLAERVARVNAEYRLVEIDQLPAIQAVLAALNEHGAPLLAVLKANHGGLVDTHGQQNAAAVQVIENVTDFFAKAQTRIAAMAAEDGKTA